MKISLCFQFAMTCIMITKKITKNAVLELCGFEAAKAMNNDQTDLH